MNLADLLSLPEFSPNSGAVPKVAVRYEDVRHVIDEIADEIWTFSLPNKGLSEDHQRDAYRWADALRSDTPTCCSIHVIESMATVLKQIEVVLRHCAHHGCDEEGNHDFLEKVGITIDKHMARFLNRIATQSEVKRRSN
jgi:hypothetical protein